MRYLILIIITSLAITYINTTLSPIIKNYTNSTKCIGDYISRGIERSDIKLEDGKCIIYPNAYYDI